MPVVVQALFTTVINNCSTRSSAWCKTALTNCQLIWKDGQHIKTVLLDLTTNVTKFRLAPGCTKYAVNCTLLDQQIGIKDQEHVIFPSTVVPDDKSLAHKEGQSAATDQEEGIAPVNEVAGHSKNDNNINF
eukprot:11827876-Ditylum_brightwellii.AAC.1